MRRLVLGSIVLAACSSSSGDPTSSGAAAAVYADAPHLVGPATEGELDVPFSLAVTGAGTSRIGRIELAAGAGSAELDGRTVQAAAIADVGYAGQSVYQVLAVDAARWAVVWLYCANGALSGAYFESTDAPGAVASERIAGTCVGAAAPTSVHVAFPSFDVAPPALLGRPFQVSGEGIAYDGNGPGTLTIGGSPLALYPFGVVDCTQGCADIGWYELHSLLWDPEERRASFGIVYLYEDRTFPVELAYTMTLPTLTRFGDALDFPGAAWSE